MDSDIIRDMINYFYEYAIALSSHNARSGEFPIDSHYGLCVA